MTLRWNLENLWSYEGWVGAEGSGVGMRREKYYAGQG